MTPEIIQKRKELVKGWLSRTLLSAGANGISVVQISEAIGMTDASGLYKYANTNEASQNIHLHNLLPLLQET